MLGKNQPWFDDGFNYKPTASFVSLIILLSVAIMQFDYLNFHYFEKINEIFNDPTIAVKQDLGLILIPFFTYLYVGTIIFLAISIVKKAKPFLTYSLNEFLINYGLVYGIVSSLVIFGLLLPTGVKTVGCLISGFVYGYGITFILYWYSALKSEFS